MPDRKAPAGRSRLSQREKEENSEERSHPAPFNPLSPGRRIASTRGRGARNGSRRCVREKVKGRRRRSECLWSFEDTLKQRLPPDGKTGRRKTRWPVFRVSRRRLRSVQPAGVGSDRGQPGDAERRRPLATPVARRTSANFGRHAKTRLIHLTMEQLPPSPFTREQSVAASSLDRPTTCSR